MNTSFENMGLSGFLLAALDKQGITVPTAIQQQVIPAVLAGRSLLARSATGTGKTLAYLLPLLEQLHPDRRENQLLILAPTYELVIQIQRQVELLIEDTHLLSVPLVGSANLARQVEKLKEKPQILVGSPGRIWELIQKRKIQASLLRFLVLDEADRLLSIPEEETVKRIVKATPRQRQLLLLSASLVPELAAEVEGYASGLEWLAADGRPAVAEEIVHQYLVCERRDKVQELRKLAHASGLKRGLVFLNRSDELDYTAARLNYHGIRTAGLHSQYSQEERKQALLDFRNERISLLVASDVAARGLDILGVEHIYNLDFPEDAEVYLHRAGRTGRAGQTGKVVSLVTVGEAERLLRLARKLSLQLQQVKVRDGRVLLCDERVQGVKRNAAKSQAGRSLDGKKRT